MKTPPVRLLVVCVAALLLSARAASAATISLSSALTGSTSTVDHIDLFAAYDPNGIAAHNLVGVELYVNFTGLTPVAGSLDYLASGSVFGPYADDVYGIDGVCADVGPCNIPSSDPFAADHYLVLLGAFAPAQPTGPGQLFSLRFVPDGVSSTWTLNIFGEENVALLSDPCAPDDSDCVAIPDPIPFAIVPSSDFVGQGTARLAINASVTTMTPPQVTPVPEPGTLMLTTLGFAALVRRRLLR